MTSHYDRPWDTRIAAFEAAAGLIYETRLAYGAARLAVLERLRPLHSAGATFIPLSEEQLQTSLDRATEDALEKAGVPALRNAMVAAQANYSSALEAMLDCPVPDDQAMRRKKIALMSFYSMAADDADDTPWAKEPVLPQDAFCQRLASHRGTASVIQTLLCDADRLNSRRLPTSEQT